MSRESYRRGSRKGEARSTLATTHEPTAIIRFEVPTSCLCSPSFPISLGVSMLASIANHVAPEKLECMRISSRPHMSSGSIEG